MQKEKKNDLDSCKKHIRDRFDAHKKEMGITDHITGLYHYVKYRWFGTEEQKKCVKYMSSIMTKSSEKCDT